MKKLFLSLAVVFSVAMVSCGGGNKAQEGEAAEAPEGEMVEVVEAQVDTNAPAGDTAVNVEAAGAAVETPAPADAPAETPAPEAAN